MPITNRPIQVLLVEDTKEHADLLGQLLGESEQPRFSFTHAASLAEGMAKVRDGTHDVVLLDLTLPDSDGAATFRSMNAVAPTVPIVILSGISDVTAAIEMVQEGAQDYLVKGHVDMQLLLRSIQYAIERKRAQASMQKADAGLEARVSERTATLHAENARLRRELADLKRAEEEAVQNNQQLTVALTAQRETSHAPHHSSEGTKEIEDALKQIHLHAELILRAPEAATIPENIADHIRQMFAAADAGRKALHLADPAAQESEVPATAANGDVQLDVLIEQVITACSADAGAEKRGASAKVVIERAGESGLAISGDAAQLAEMLKCLVKNSLAAIPRRGKITIAAQRHGADTILSVQDDGLGMTDVVRRRLLDPAAVLPRADGTASGYGMIHAVAARHSGRLEIESRKGIGSTVRVIFPPAAPTAEAKPVRGRRVLVVDDDALVREVLSTYLTEDGCAVQTACDGRAALEKFIAGEFDIVMTDRTMPDMDGDRLAAEVKELRPHVPVMLLTGHGDAMAANGEKPPCVDFVLTKPFTLTGLRNALAQFI